MGTASPTGIEWRNQGWEASAPALAVHDLQDATLRVFAEVADSGSLTEASHRLHIAASALSRRLAALETRLGVALFDRHARGMSLTAAGELLLTHARRNLLDAQSTLEAMRALNGVRSGQVRLATSDAFANELVPDVCRAFAQRYPGPVVELLVLPTAQVPEAVRQGRADLGLCFSRAPQAEVAVAYRQPAPALALLPQGHALARRRQVALSQLVGQPLALPPSDTTLRQMIDIVCSRQGLRLSPCLVSGHVQALLHFVGQGAGVSVASEIAARPWVEAGRMVARPIADAGMDLRDVEVQTLAGRTLTPAVAAFLELLKERLPAPRGQRAKRFRVSASASQNPAAV